MTIPGVNSSAGRWRSRNGGICSGWPRAAASAQTQLSPEAALQQLIDGNRRFAEGRMTSFDEDLDILKAKTVEKQEPFAAVLSCADSRVPVELIFDQSIGTFLSRGLPETSRLRR